MKARKIITTTLLILFSLCCIALTLNACNDDNAKSIDMEQQKAKVYFYSNLFENVNCPVRVSVFVDGKHIGDLVAPVDTTKDVEELEKIMDSTYPFTSVIVYEIDVPSKIKYIAK